MDFLMCSAPPFSRRSIDGMHDKRRSCWRMKTHIHFRLPRIFARGANGKSVPYGCNIDEHSRPRSAVAASMSPARICARSDSSDHHERHEDYEAAWLCSWLVCVALV